MMYAAFMVNGRYSLLLIHQLMWLLSIEFYAIYCWKAFNTL